MMVEMDKKAITTLRLLVVLIVAFLTLALAIVVVVRMGFVRGLQIGLCTTLTTFGANIRGIVVDLLWWFYRIIIWVGIRFPCSNSILKK